MTVDERRERMVDEQLRSRGVDDPRVLAVMATVPRHLFVDEHLRERAYEDSPLPIGHHQTISQPYVVALMTAALGLRGGERVLEVGTGSGYQAAILAALGAQVVSLECVSALATRARATLHALGMDGLVQVLEGDGTLGWPALAPYDGILVAAGGPQVPRPLLEQLAPGAALVMPLGEPGLQDLVRLHRTADGRLVEESFGECRFVRLRGRYGWNED